MPHNYEEIVRIWYNRLRPAFLRKLTLQYPSLSLGEAENLYQDAFIAIYDNLQAGRIKEDTSWSSYILTIGLNLANKALRQTNVADLLKEIPEDDLTLINDLEAQSILGRELEHTPDPCAAIIKAFYYDNWSMEEIAEEIGYKNAQTVKAKKSQCMTDLIARVSDAMKRAGFDLKPKKRNGNGKN